MYDMKKEEKKAKIVLILGIFVLIFLLIIVNLSIVILVKKIEKQGLKSIIIKIWKGDTN